MIFYRARTGVRICDPPVAESIANSNRARTERRLRRSVRDNAGDRAIPETHIFHSLPTSLAKDVK